MMKFLFVFVLLLTVSLQALGEVCPEIDGGYRCFNTSYNYSFYLRIIKRDNNYVINSENWYKTEIVADGIVRPWPQLQKGSQISFCAKSGIKINYEGFGNYGIPTEGVESYYLLSNHDLKITSTEIIDRNFVKVEISNCQHENYFDF